MGARIKVALATLQEEKNVVIKKSVIQYQVEVHKSDFKSLALIGEESQAANVIDLNRFKEKNSLPPALSRSEILLQDNVSIEDFEPIRNVLIGKYIQAQRNTVYLKNDPTLEIKI